MMKKAKDYLDEANAIVRRVTPEEAIQIHASGQAVFIDVRDSNSLRQTGVIAGATHVPRGMLAAKIHEGCILACDGLFGAFRFSMAHG